MPLNPEALRSAAATLLAVAPTLPRKTDIAPELEDARRAAARGYFLPDEDERVRHAFARYLHARAALLATIAEVRRGVDPARPGDLPAFTIALAAACMLVRSARYLVQLGDAFPEVARKLDEPDGPLGIPRKAYTRVYRSLTKSHHLFDFFRALRYAQEHEADIAALAFDPTLAPVVEILQDERGHTEEIRKRVLVRHRLRYRLHSLRRRKNATLGSVLFALFEVSGRALAEVRLGTSKRVTPAVQEAALALLEPGDVLVTRHHDAASNLFLPGYWPHAALYLGGGETLEAKKDGVKTRALAETLSVDAFAIIRPQLSPEELAAALARARTHEGKLYDFEFDFRRADRLVCTEVIYRTYHGAGAIAFAPAPRSGRICLTAEQLLDHAVDGRGFGAVAVFTGGEIRGGDALAATYRK